MAPKDVNNVNLKRFCTIMSALTGMQIVPKNVNPSPDGRDYYIQPPKRNCPMLLNHYRDNYMGLYAIDMHQDDYTDIISGKVDPQVYIDQAKWLVGYFRGGGSMITGGNYWPFDIVGESNDLKCELQMLSCQTSYIASHYEPDKQKCTNCWVKADCPFSSEKAKRDWSFEIDGPDPRLDLFKVLCAMFDRRFGPEYSIHGFSCGNLVPREEAWLRANPHFRAEEPYEVTLVVSSEVIRDLLMREVVPDDWSEYAKKFRFRLKTGMQGATVDLTKESLEKAFEDCDYVKKSEEQPEEQPEEAPEQRSFLNRFWDSFKNLFH